MRAKIQSVRIMQRNQNIYPFVQTVELHAVPTLAAKLVELTERKLLQQRKLNKLAVRSQKLAHWD
jgi:hypothetical protein